MSNRRVLWLLLIIFAVLIHQNLRLLSVHTLTGEHAYAASFLRGFVPSASSQDGMVACLMVRDDNLLLPEWIAYHFTVLPLRDLVIAADLGSTQDVSLISNKWTSLLNMTVWNASHFMNRFGEISVPLNDTNHHYLHRQRAFITTCAAYFKRLNKTWVAFVDTDEYITINRMPLYHEESYFGLVVGQRRAALQSSTVLEAIQAAEAVMDTPVKPCHGMPRLLYGALENITCKDATGVKDAIHRNRFSYVPTTIRYVQHATKGAFYPANGGRCLWTSLDYLGSRFSTSQSHRIDHSNNVANLCLTLMNRSYKSITIWDRGNAIRHVLMRDVLEKRLKNEPTFRTEYRVTIDYGNGFLGL